MLREHYLKLYKSSLKCQRKRSFKVLQEHYPQALEIIFEMQRQKEFKVLQEHYPQALEIIFEVQRKRSNEKIIKKKTKAFQLTKCIFFSSFFSLWTPLIFKSHNFFNFLFIFVEVKFHLNENIE